MENSQLIGFSASECPVKHIPSQPVATGVIRQWRFDTIFQTLPSPGSKLDNTCDLYSSMFPVIFCFPSQRCLKWWLKRLKSSAVTPEKWPILPWHGRCASTTLLMPVQRRWLETSFSIGEFSGSGWELWLYSAETWGANEKRIELHWVG